MYFQLANRFIYFSSKMSLHSKENASHFAVGLTGVIPSLVVVGPLNSWTGQPAQTQCLEWFLFPPAWLQFLLLRHFCASDTESVTLLLLHRRLPGPTARVSAAGSDAKARGGSAAANNRRSQSFNNYDKSKPVTSPPPPPPPSSHEKGKSPLGFFLSSFV